MSFQPPPASIARQVELALAILARHLGPRIEAIHLFGSAVQGGLKPQSDIDLLVTVSAPLPEPLRQTLMQDLLGVSAWPATLLLRPLEVTVVARDAVKPWRYPARRELQFGEWLREDLSRGIVEAPLTDPDLAILIAQARQYGIPLLGPPAAVWFDPISEADILRAYRDTVDQWQDAADWLGDEQTVVLALARIWYSTHTGRIVPKDVAADWAAQRLPDTLRRVLACARASYLGQAPDTLAEQPEAVESFVLAVKREISRNGEPG